MARKDYEEEEVFWDEPPEEEAVEEIDDTPDEPAEVEPVPDPVVEIPETAPKGVVYRRLPNGALTTD